MRMQKVRMQKQPLKQNHQVINQDQDNTVVIFQRKRRGGTNK